MYLNNSNKGFWIGCGMVEETEKGFELIKILQEVAGDELNKIETIEKIKNILIDFLRGYPAWRYYGIFEFYFPGKLGKKIIQTLKSHNVLDVLEEEGRTYYSLKPKGIEIAISLSDREDSKRILYYAKETHKFNRWIKWLTIILSIIGLAHLFLAHFQNPIF